MRWHKIYFEMRIVNRFQNTTIHKRHEMKFVMLILQLVFQTCYFIIIVILVLLFCKVKNRKKSTIGGGGGTQIKSIIYKTDHTNQFVNTNNKYTNKHIIYSML